MRRTLIVVSALTAFAVASCSDDGPDSSSQPEPAETTAPAGTDSTAPDQASALAVVAHDIGFDAEEYETTAGSVDVSYTNEGVIPHTLVIEGVDGFKLEVTSTGDVDEGAVELEAGTYTIFCDVPGHREAGMEATLGVS